MFSPHVIEYLQLNYSSPIGIEFFFLSKKEHSRKFRNIVVDKLKTRWDSPVDCDPFPMQFIHQAKSTNLRFITL